MNQFVIDCGSRSIKLHETRPGAVSLWATRSWDPIGETQSLTRLGELFVDLTRQVPPSGRVHVVGTAAARRDPGVADAIRSVCLELGWSYETLSHAAEADLIRAAFGSEAARDIINVGGGSIQIVPPSGEPVLLGFGISDLNRDFGLGRAPDLRRVEAARAFVAEALPAMPRTFIYSGGELSYLRAMGARIDADGRCSAAEFVRVADEVDATDYDALELRSPFDPGWIRGAVASNVIVRACLERSGVDHYFASDINIADGVIAGLAGRAGHAADAGL